MPFLQAGFNARHRRTGIFAFTMPADRARRRPAAPAELIRFRPSGDFAWVGTRRRFVAWPECCLIVDQLPLPIHVTCTDWPASELPA